MDMKISGSGHIAAGRYENIHISGSARLGSPVQCQSLHCSGASHGEGNLDAQQEISISGSAHFEGNVSAQDIKISGSAGIDGNCTSTEDMQISGSMRCGGDIKGNSIRISGSLHVTNMEGEDVNISGKITCPGLLNAENIVIKMFGSTSEIGSIGGSSIRVTVERNHPEVTRLISKLLGRHGHVGLTVKESIEGDDISLERVTAKSVTGRTVAIGAGCHIELVQYSEAIEISPDAKVKRQERI